MPASHGAFNMGAPDGYRQHWGNGQKKSQPIWVGILGIGGVWLTVCRLASRAYEHFCWRERVHNKDRSGLHLDGHIARWRKIWGSTIYLCDHLLGIWIFFGNAWRDDYAVKLCA